MKLAKRQSELLIAALAVLIYFLSLGHGFVLDDKIVITHNEFTKKGFDGIGDAFFNDSMTGFFGKDKKLVAGGRYRPLTMSLHAAEYQIFGENALAYHLINILLYIFIGILVYRILLRLFPPEIEGQRNLNALFISLVYMAHPLHTEVVANIKSQDELLSILFAFSAWELFLKNLDTKSWKVYVLPAVLLFLSLLSKESSVAFALLIPLSGFMILRLDIKKTLILGAPLISAVILYVGMRYMIIGSAKLEVAKELMNNPFLNASSSDKFATIFLTYLEYFRLLVIPHPLTHDYYPKHIPIVSWTDVKVILSLVVHGALVVWAYVRRNDRQLLFWMLFYFASFFLYSNLIFNIGTFMNERFLFVSSLSYAVLLVTLIQTYFKKSEKLRMALLFGFIIIYGALSLMRVPAWESDRTLALTDVEVSSNSAKAQMAAGSAYLDWAKEERIESKKLQYLNKGIKHLARSLEIYPRYFPPTILMGNSLAEAGRYKESLIYFKTCFQLNPKHPDALNNSLFVAQRSAEKKDFVNAIQAYELLLTQEKKPIYFSALGEIYGKELQNLEESKQVLMRGIEYFPQDSDLNQKLGVVYAMQGKPRDAIGFFERALEQNPNNGHLYLNIGIAYRSLGQTELAEKNISKALELEPSLRDG